MTLRRVLLRAPAVLFVLGATFHAIALARPDFGDPSPAWRHALFLAINAAFAVGFWRRPSWLPWAYLPLALQQTWSHGVDIVRSAQPLAELQSWSALISIPWFAWAAWSAREARPGR